MTNSSQQKLFIKHLLEIAIAQFSSQIFSDFFVDITAAL